MKREELVEYSVVCIDDIPSDVRGEAINGCTSFFAFDAVDTEDVMDAYERRIKELEASEYKWFALVRDFVTVLGNDPYMVYVAIESRLKQMCDNDEIERWNKVNQSILDRIKVVRPHEWNRTLDSIATTEDSSETEK